MKCPNPNCRAENPDGATFCRACGRKFLFVDRYPEFMFVKTDKQTIWPYAGLAALFKTFSAFGVVIAVFMFGYIAFSWNHYNEEIGTYIRVEDYSGNLRSYWNCESIEEALNSYHSNLLESIIPFSFIFIVSSTILIGVRKIKIHKANSSINSPYDLADYISKTYYQEYTRLRNTHTYSFYIKGNKLGIIDISARSIFLSGYEDAKKAGAFVFLKKDGLWSLLEVKRFRVPQILIPPRFQDISLSKSSDAVFKVTENNRTFTIDKYGRELK